MARPSKQKDRFLDAIGIALMRNSEAVESLPQYKDIVQPQSKSVPSVDVKYFIPDSTHFSPLKKPKRGEWLSEHREADQTYKRYITCGISCPTRRHTTIYLQPLTFKEDCIPAEVLKPLQQFASIYFGTPVKVLKVKNMCGKVTDRINDGVYQVHAGEILTKMKEFIPGDAFCMAGITMCDLYQRDDWNYVFGYAELGGRCGVYSLARYLTSFGEGTHTQINLDMDPIPSVLLRACKTMCHEIGHMFGIRHCTFYSCIMNGSNHLREADSKPVFLCPVCLRKLHHVCKFDILNRYKDMYQFWTESKVQAPADWLQSRIEKLSS